MNVKYGKDCALPPNPILKFLTLTMIFFFFFWGMVLSFVVAYNEQLLIPG